MKLQRRLSQHLTASHPSLSNGERAFRRRRAAVARSGPLSYMVFEREEDASRTQAFTCEAISG